MDIPIELFLGFIATTFIMIIIGIVRNPQIPALIVFAGMFLLTITITTDNIIMGQLVTLSTFNTTNTEYDYEPDLFPFTEMVKVIFALFAVILMLSGALLTRMGDSFG